MTNPNAALRNPFPEEAVGKLPKITCTACSKSSTKNCDRHKKTKCKKCGNYISTEHTHLDYVGHAHVTERLLEVDPGWTWEPMAEQSNGTPAFDDNGGLWIRLTVNGVTRVGYGDAAGKRGGNAVKEAIGDCLVRGTPILTARGVIPIESVQVGDIVPTRSGWRPVTDHWLSSRAAPVVAALLADGRVIVGTPQHQVPTTNGVKRMAALRNADMVYAWQGTDDYPALTRCSGTAGDTAATLTTPTVIAASTTWPQQVRGATYIAMFTRPQTVRSPQGGTSTISTMIQTTTIRPTLWRSRQLPTPSITAATGPSSSGHATSAVELLTRYKLGHGGVPLPAKNGGGDATASLMSAHAWALWLSPGGARSAGADISPASLGRGSARLPVVAVADAGLAEVWNISVSDVHEYVANGIFVLNSIRNAAMRFGVALDLWKKEVPSTEDLPSRTMERVEQTDEQKKAEIRGQIGLLGRVKGKPIEQVAADFYQWSRGTDITEASLVVLTEYRDHMQQVER